MSQRIRMVGKDKLEFRVPDGAQIKLLSGKFLIPYNEEYCFENSEKDEPWKNTEWFRIDGYTYIFGGMGQYIHSVLFSDGTEVEVLNPWNPIKMTEKSLEEVADWVSKNTCTPKDFWFANLDWQKFIRQNILDNDFLFYRDVEDESQVYLEIYMPYNSDGGGNPTQHSTEETQVTRRWEEIYLPRGWTVKHY